MVEDILLIKNSDVCHLQDNLLWVFWDRVEDKVSELLGLQVENYDADDRNSFPANVGDDDSPAETNVANVGDDDSPAETNVADVGDDNSSAETNVADVGDDDSPGIMNVWTGELPAKLVTAGEELLAAIAAMKEAYQRVNFKSMTAEIRKRDEERDSMLRGVKSLVKAMARFSSKPEQQAAAMELLKSMKQWKLNPKEQYLLETEVVHLWLEDVSNSEQLTEAVAVLGLTDILARLGELGEEVSRLISDRNVEEARKQSLQQRQRRKYSEQAWQRFTLVFNAAAVMDPDEHRYDSFVKLMNYLLKQSKREMRHIRKKHPRKRDA